MKQEGMTPEVAKKFKYWQTRTIIASMIGYALFYFVRKNLSIAMPAMQEDLGITKGDLGSLGMVFLFAVICVSSSIFSTAFPVRSKEVRSISIKWLSVPPETILMPLSISPLQRACALSMMFF